MLIFLLGRYILDLLKVSCVYQWRYGGVVPKHITLFILHEMCEWLCHTALCVYTIHTYCSVITSLRVIPLESFARVVLVSFKFSRQLLNLH